MPPTPRLPRSPNSLYRDVVPKPFICPSCIYQRALSPTFTAPLKARWSCGITCNRIPYIRHATSIAPVTVVNAIKTIHSHNKRLYDELVLLKKQAATFVNLSQLQLALRSLESEDPVIRVAILSLSDQRSAKRLVRALLADPLAPEPEWERFLVDEAEEDARALVIRYGEEYDYDQRHPLLVKMSIPSTLLDRHKIELLVYNVDARQQKVTRSLEVDSQDLLVPALDTPISATGRSSMVTYPVHQVLIWGEGVEGIMAMPRAISLPSDKESNTLFRGAINASWEAPKSQVPPEPRISLVNLAESESAISTFRASLNNSLDYEHRWLASNIPTLTEFLLSGATTAPSRTLKPAIHSLIHNILAEANSVISSTRADRLAALAASGVPESTRNALSEAVTDWAEAAHIELRDALDFGFDSSAWRKTAWWKLLWRVDDVGYISSQVVQRCFLVEAEKKYIWISGRMHEAGLSTSLSTPSQLPKNKPIPHRLGAVSPGPSLRDLSPSSASVHEDSFDPSEIDIKPSLPQQIALIRGQLLASIPTLQARSQTLLLQSLSTTVLTTTLSTLLYVSVSTTSLYEVGVIGALGFVWSARRLQREWERARAEWASRVREEGRKVLGVVEGSYRGLITGGGKAIQAQQAEDSEELTANRALERAKEALEDME